MSYFVHPNALCESNSIGFGTRIWAFAHILSEAIIGVDCNICDGVFVENKVIIGNRVTIKNGVQLWDGVTLEDDVFIGPNVTFTNDIFPRSKCYPEKFLTTLICSGASIGANATILPGLIIGKSAMVGAGAVVTQSVPPFAIVVGNPARIIGYVNTPQSKDDLIVSKNEVLTQVKGVSLIRFNQIKDLRGNLCVGEFDRDIPFIPKRYFFVYDVPNEKTRGQHAHKQCHQLLICVKGQCSVVADDGVHRDEYFLNSPALGIHIPPMVWCTQYKYSQDAVLLVFASDYYDATDYIRDYDEFCNQVSIKTLV